MSAVQLHDPLLHLLLVRQQLGRPQEVSVRVVVVVPDLRWGPSRAQHQTECVFRGFQTNNNHLFDSELTTSLLFIRPSQTVHVDILGLQISGIFLNR